MAYRFYDLSDYEKFAEQIGFQMKKNKDGVLYYQGFETDRFGRKTDNESKITLYQLGLLHKVVRDLEKEAYRDVINTVEVECKRKSGGDLVNKLKEIVTGYKHKINYLESKIKD